MALQTKTFTSDKVNYYSLSLTLTENSVNQSANTSEIAYKLTLNAGGAYFSSYAVGHEISLAGKVVSGSYRPNAPQYSVAKNGSVVIASGTATVAHGSDGTLNMSVAFSIDMAKVDYTPGAISVSGQTMALTKIARGSTVKATDANIGAVSTVTINKMASAYTHSVKYSFGSLSGYLTEAGGVSSSEVEFSAASVAWTVPTSFYAQIPNATSGVCTLTVTTYSGGSKVGEAQSARMTVTAVEADCRPYVSGAVEDVNATTLALTGDKNKIVRFYSTPRCTITASAKNGASISARAVNNVAITDGNSVDIASPETVGFTFTARDSRGYQGSVFVRKTLVPYVKLTANASCDRGSPTSNTVAVSVSGAYYNGSFGATDNTLSIVCKSGSKSVELTPTFDGNTYTATGEIEGLSYTSSHTVTVTVTDALESVEKRLSVTRGIPVFDWGESDFNFNVPVKIEGGSAAYIVEEKKSGIWRYRKWSNGDAECWGTYSGNVTVNKSMANVYYSPEVSVKYPFTFTEAPVCTVSGGSASTINWARKFGNESTTSAVFIIVAMQSQSLVAVSVNLHAFGRWK